MSFDLKKFVTVISCEPCLYDVDNPNYKYLPYKESKWQEIGEMFGLSGHEARSKFKSLRDKYRREKGRMELEAKQPQLFAVGDNAREPWELMDDMKFLDTVRGRPPRSRPFDYAMALPDNDDDVNDEDFSPHRKRQLIQKTPVSPTFKFKPIMIPPQKNQQQQQQQQHIRQQQQHSSMNNSFNSPRPAIKREANSHGMLQNINRQHPQMRTQPPKQQNYNGNDSQTESPNSSTSDSSKHITLGSFIDQMVDQEPEETRERFSVELLDAVVKIKKQFIGEREKQLSDLYTISQEVDD